jgi:hypothetical protein
MKFAGLFVAALAFAALGGCGDSDQDKLSDDLATAEQGSGLDSQGGANYAEDVNEVAAEAARRTPDLSNIADDDPSEPADSLAPLPDTAAERPVATANVSPSFNCGLATTDVEEWICDQPALAAADRAMAANYRRALGQAEGARAMMLRRTADNFLRYRNQCPDPDCVAQAYQGRLREIADIMGR